MIRRYWALDQMDACRGFSLDPFPLQDMVNKQDDGVLSKLNQRSTQFGHGGSRSVVHQVHQGR